MKVCVEIWNSPDSILMVGRSLGVVRKGVGGCIASYVVDHDDAHQRRTMGEQCRNAFEAGQCVVTYPHGSN